MDKKKSLLKTLLKSDYKELKKCNGGVNSVIVTSGMLHYVKLFRLYYLKTEEMKRMAENKSK